MKKSCYVIASWGGERRNECQESVSDKTFFLKNHLYWLSKTKKSVDSILIVSAEDDSVSKDYLKHIEEVSLLKDLDGTPIRVIRRDNVGLSYGSFLCALNENIDDYQYFFFVEDDYVPIMNGFDDILIDKIESHGYGFLCGAVRDRNLDIKRGISATNHKTHAGAFIGIIHRDAAKFLKYDEYIKTWTDSQMHFYRKSEHFGQVMLSQDMIRSGMPLVDWLEEYSTLFYGRSKRIEKYGVGLPIFVPSHIARTDSPQITVLDMFTKEMMKYNIFG